jgi:hypothetical protein
MIKNKVVRIDEDNYNWLVSLAKTDQHLNGVLTEIRLGRMKSNSNLKNQGDKNETKGNQTK